MYSKIDDFALELINDTLTHSTEFYYYDEDTNQVETIWEPGEEARLWGIWYVYPFRPSTPDPNTGPNSLTSLL